MSLKEAMLDLANDMEADVNEEDTIPSSVMRGYIRSIRMAVKAAPDDSVPLPAQLPVMNPMQADPMQSMVHHFQQVERAKEEMRQKKEEGVEREIGEHLVEVIGSPDSEDGIPETTVIDASMPVGAKTAIGGCVYIRGTDGKLHYSREDTEKIKASQKGKIVLG